MWDVVKVNAIHTVVFDISIIVEITTIFTAVQMFTLKKALEDSQT